jgi:hypothetical protein
MTSRHTTRPQSALWPEARYRGGRALASENVSFYSKRSPAGAIAVARKVAEKTDKGYR